MTVSHDENLLSRWSRRKLQSEELTQREDLAIAAERDEISALEDLQQGSDISQLQQELKQEVLTDEDMPAIESLDENSDFSPFMSSGVSDELRNLALRKLFKASVFNIRDGLDEYDEDYTSFEKLGDIITCDMKHQVEMEARKKLQREAEALEQQATAQALDEQGVQEDAEELIDAADEPQTDMPEKSEAGELAEIVNGTDDSGIQPQPEPSINHESN